MARAGHSDKEIFDRVASLIKRLLKSPEEGNLLGIPELRRETDIFNELGIDSVEAMDLMALIEQEFSVSIDLERIAKKHTVGEITEYVGELLQQA